MRGSLPLKVLAIGLLLSTASGCVSNSKISPKAASAISNQERAKVKAKPEVCNIWRTRDPDEADTEGTQEFLVWNNAARNDYCRAE